MNKGHCVWMWKIKCLVKFMKPLPKNSKTHPKKQETLKRAALFLNVVSPYNPIQSCDGCFGKGIYFGRVIYKLCKKKQGQCLHKQSHILATLFQRMFQDSCCYMNKLKTYHSPSDFLRVRGVQHRYRHTSHGLSMGSKCGSYLHARLFQEFVVIPQIWLYRWATAWSLQTKQVLNIYIIPIIAFGREKIMSEVHFRMSKQNN